jgi:ATP-dependent Clp protease ATP-binding subunit ClpC
MDDGVLTDGQGRSVDFKNTIIIMTSNAGSSFLNRDSIGFGSIESEEDQDIKLDQQVADRINTSLKSYFKPEFLNRIDDVIIFGSLSKKDIRRVVEKELKILNKNIEEGGYILDFSEEAKDYLAGHGYNHDMGARPLRRLIQREIENKLSELIIDEKLKNGDTVKITSDGSVLDIKVHENSAVNIGA